MPVIFAENSLTSRLIPLEGALMIGDLGFEDGIDFSMTQEDWNVALENAKKNTGSHPALTYLTADDFKHICRSQTRDCTRSPSALPPEKDICQTEMLQVIREASGENSK